MSGSMGDRLAWARNQRGLILQEVSNRSGLAIGYISQLEKGAKVNPTIDALKRLAVALGVSMAFVMGEVQAPPYDDHGASMISGRAWAIGRQFAKYFDSLSRKERDRILFESVEQRFGRVIDFLCDQFPDTFTPTVVAFQLGLSVRALNDILERDCEVGPMVLGQMVSISGIPMTFFAKGQMDTAAAEITPAQFIQYAEAIAEAAKAQVSPEQLVLLIRQYSHR